MVTKYKSGTKQKKITILDSKYNPYKLTNLVPVTNLVPWWGQHPTSLPEHKRAGVVQAGNVGHAADTSRSSCQQKGAE